MSKIIIYNQLYDIFFTAGQSNSTEEHVNAGL